nr:hypothetical protein Iba_chr03dCG4350 [Ipomoea batatas]
MSSSSGLLLQRAETFNAITRAAHCRRKRRKNVLELPPQPSSTGNRGRRHHRRCLRLRREIRWSKMDHRTAVTALPLVYFARRENKEQEGEMPPPNTKPLRMTAKKSVAAKTQPPVVSSEASTLQPQPEVAVSFSNVPKHSMPSPEQLTVGEREGRTSLSCRRSQAPLETGGEDTTVAAYA